MDQDIGKFVAAVGATEPPTSDERYAQFRKIFRRQNYFFLEGRFLIIKISRSERPFWGVGKEFVDLMPKLENSYLVLLTSTQEGWIFSKSDIDANIRSGKWKLREADANYKINMPLPDRNAFAGPKSFRRKLGIDKPDSAPR
jgi:hypothetical protein